LIDKATLFGLVAKGLSAQWSGLPPEEKRGYMRRCLSLNLATQSLFDQLLDEGTGRPVVIVCHSQGNLITGNALNALSWVQGGSLHFIKCFCVASPAIFWPGGTSSQFFTNTDDLVPFGSFGLNLFRDKKWSRQSGANLNAPYVAPDIFMDAHDIKRYLCQPDFVSAIRKVLGLSDTFPTAPLATPGALPGQPGTYVIKPGDTLATIALQFYGNASRWRRIYDNKENQKKIGSNPNVIFPGQVLLIP
jgi:LysM repeat protein